MRRVLLISGCILGAVVLALVLIWAYAGRTGSTDLEDWIGTQIVQVLENYITPEVEFSSLDYRLPRTVAVEGLILTAAGARIVEVHEMVLELAEVPRQGRPILVQQIRLTRPHMLFRATEGGLVGWSDFIESRAMEEPEMLPPGQRLSDVLVLRHVEVTDGQIVYEEEGRPKESMTLPGVQLTLDTPPVEDEPGAYALSGQLQRAPVFHMTLEGKVNLDTLMLEIEEWATTVNLNQEGWQALPPALQRFLREHKVRGTLTGLVAGELPLERPEDATGQFALELRDGRLAYGDLDLAVGTLAAHGAMPDGDVNVEIVKLSLRSDGASGMQGELNGRFVGTIPPRAPSAAHGTAEIELLNATFSSDDQAHPIESVRASVDLHDGVADVDYEGRALSGRIAGTGSVQLRAPRSFDIRWQVKGAELEEALRAIMNDPPNCAGSLSTEGQVRGRLAALPESLRGGGKVAVREGRLVNLPIIGQIMAMLAKIPLPLRYEPDDKADVRFELTGSGVRIEEAEIVGLVALMRGDGRIGYDSSLDLVVNAGVLEKLQSHLGGIGDLLGMISDRAVTYTVRGTIDDPKIGVRAFGFGK